MKNTLSFLTLIMMLVLTFIWIDSASAFTELTISEIQGDGEKSIYEGQEVTTSGVVTLISANGRDMWIQDPSLAELSMDYGTTLRASDHDPLECRFKFK